MAERKVELEWHLTNSDREWLDVRPLESPGSTAPKNIVVIWHKFRTSGLLLVLIALGAVIKQGTRHYEAQFERSRPAYAVRTGVERDDIIAGTFNELSPPRMNHDGGDDPGPQSLHDKLELDSLTFSAKPAVRILQLQSISPSDYSYLYFALRYSESTDLPPADRLPPLTQIQNVDIRNDIALVDLLIRPPVAATEAKIYRALRFYRRSSDGWQETKPIEELWGSQKRLETDHFIFHYRQRDAEAV